MNPVDVIVPIYRGLDETRACVESVLRARCETAFRLILIDDCSPESELVDYIDSLAAREDVLVLHNSRNLGFVKTANLGMAASERADVVLLNSDAEVAGDWLDRLTRHAHSAENIGTVTPFSNNATICSYPGMPGTATLPRGESVDSMDRAFAAANPGRSLDLPTAVGFCMLIRRDCLSQVGPFDEVTFGRGYGEENDFCMRATSLGWRHLLAADTFVFHAGEVSFRTHAKEAKAQAMTTLRARYPDYMPAVSKHIERDEALPFRVAATAARWRAGRQPVILLISHANAGGTEKHMRELVEQCSERARFLLLEPQRDGTDFTLVGMNEGEPLEIRLSAEDPESLESFLESCGVTRIHVHHLLHVPIDVKRLIRSLGVPFDFTVHDYFGLCPQVRLTDGAGEYCGEPSSEGCNRCIAARPRFGARDIRAWRRSHEWLFLAAERVICPSRDVAERCRRYHPTANIVVVPHDDCYSGMVEVKIPNLVEGETLRVATLGTMAPHKGSDILSAAALRAASLRLPMAFHLIGSPYSTHVPMPFSPQAPLFQTGEYDDKELPSLIESIDPHVILFPARWPETYSYTLTYALRSRLPIIAPDVGAFPERLRGRPWTWIVDWDISASQLVQLLVEIRDSLLQRRPPETPRTEISTEENADSGFYALRYL